MKIKNIIFFHLLSLPSFLVVLIISSIVYHQPEDFTITFSMDLFFQGLTYTVSAVGIFFIVIRLYFIYKRKGTALSLILVDYFITVLIVSSIQVFLSFFHFNDDNLELLGETFTIIGLISINFTFWFFLFELFQNGEKSSRFTVKSSLIMFGYLVGSTLGIFQGMFGNVTKLIVVVIALPLVVINVYINIVVARNGISLSRLSEKRNEKVGLLFIGLSGILIAFVSILAFLDYVVFDQSALSGTLVGLFYLIGFIFLYLGFISPMKVKESIKN
ncbi:MAG: hypothetical protein ACTSUE_21840 [Promethearchaeota archaeon]